MITKQDRLSILITFTIGLVAGFYFYLTGYSFKFSGISKEDTYSDFSIVGEAYGNCQREGCLSFQLLSDGSYRVLVKKTNVGTVSKEGIIPRSLRTELTRNVDTKILKQQSQKGLATNCASSDGGVDYKFKITRAGEDYELDTCKTRVAYDSGAWGSLAKLWNHFQTLN